MVESEKELQKKLCCYCFANLEHFLDHKKVLEFDNDFDGLGDYAIFVTYKKDDHLRGCIGSFKPKPLGQQLQSYSLVAALKDSRFSPIKKEELQILSCEVSLLSHFENIEDIYDWEVGTHGVEIEFSEKPI